MNTLRFEIREHPDADHKDVYFDVHFMVDGSDLLDKIKAIEADCFKEDALDEDDMDEDVAPFAGLSPEQLYENLTKEAVNGVKKVFILICVHCRCIGCMEFNTTIIEQDDKVIWTNFYAGSGVAGDYSSLNGMEFDKEEYWREVERLKDYFGQDCRCTFTW